MKCSGSMACSGLDTAADQAHIRPPRELHGASPMGWAPPRVKHIRTEAEEQAQTPPRHDTCMHACSNPGALSCQWK